MERRPFKKGVLRERKKKKGHRPTKTERGKESYEEAEGKRTMVTRRELCGESIVGRAGECLRKGLRPDLRRILEGVDVECKSGTMRPLDSYAMSMGFILTDIGERM